MRRREWYIIHTSLGWKMRVRESLRIPWNADIKPFPCCSVSCSELGGTTWFDWNGTGLNTIPYNKWRIQKGFFKSKVHYYYALGFSLFITLNLRDKNLSNEPKCLGSNSVFKRKGFKYRHRHRHSNVRRLTRSLA